jgi:DNA-binding transcriptional regulator YiaG
MIGRTRCVRHYPSGNGQGTDRANCTRVVQLKSADALCRLTAGTVEYLAGTVACLARPLSLPTSARWTSSSVRWLVAEPPAAHDWVLSVLTGRHCGFVWQNCSLVLDIRAARQARRLRQKRLAAMIGARPSELSRWEQGVRTMPERWQWELVRVPGMPSGMSSGRQISGIDHERPRAKAPVERHVTLRERRGAAGLSQPQLADRAGVHPVALAQYESSQARSSLATIELRPSFPGPK